jgi:hypothetical protein
MLDTPTRRRTDTTDALDRPIGYTHTRTIGYAMPEACTCPYAIFVSTARLPRCCVELACVSVARSIASPLRMRCASAPSGTAVMACDGCDGRSSCGTVAARPVGGGRWPHCERWWWRRSVADHPHIAYTQKTKPTQHLEMGDTSPPVVLGEEEQERAL